MKKIKKKEFLRFKILKFSMKISKISKNFKISKITKKIKIYLRFQNFHKILKFVRN
jgi:hypothetical protein